MLNLVISSPEHPIFSGSVDRVILPGEISDFEVLPNHAPIMSALKMGTIIAYPTGNEPLAFCIDAGLAQVNNNHISVLVDTAFKARCEERNMLLTQQTEYRKKLDKSETIDYGQLLQQLAKLSAELSAIDRIQEHRKKT